MQSRPSPVLIAVPVALLATLLCAASAFGQIAGFTITPPVTSNPTMTGEDATFDVLAYGETPGLTLSATYRAGDPLNNSSATTFTNSYDFGNGNRPYQVRLFVNSQWNWGDYPAIEYGDGAERQVMALALDPMSTEMAHGAEGVTMNTFRGTFNHTYAAGNYTITSRLTPDETYPVTAPGVDIASGGLTTGNASTGTLMNTFTYQVTVSPLSPPGTGTYTYQNTNITPATFTNTVRQVTNTTPVTIVAPGPTLDVTGSCPGMATIDITGLTPGARVTFWASDTAGSTPIGVGPCASTEIDLDVVEPRRRAFADGMGNYSFSRFFFFGQCGVMMQAVNHGNCGKSPVVTGVTPGTVAVPTGGGSTPAAGGGPAPGAGLGIGSSN